MIVKSTVVPGTTDTFVKSQIEKISRKKFGEFGLGMNPEFLREGDAVEDFLFPDRIVLGADHPAGWSAPSTILSGNKKSSTASPSRKNSGFIPSPNSPNFFLEIFSI